MTVALEALRGDMTAQEVSARHKVHPNQISTWKRQAIEGMGDVFFGKKQKAVTDKDSEIHDPHVKIRRLTMEWDFLANGPKRNGRPHPAYMPRSLWNYRPIHAEWCADHGQDDRQFW